MSQIGIKVSQAAGVKCSRCWRVVPWHVAGVDLCTRCRDVGIEDGWLCYDADKHEFYKNPDWKP